MQELIPFILKANTSLIEKKKDTGKFSASRKWANTESMLQMVIGFLLYGGKPTHVNREFQSCRKKQSENMWNFLVQPYILLPISHTHKTINGTS